MRKYENEIGHLFALYLRHVDETLFVIGRFPDELLLLMESTKLPKVMLEKRSKPKNVSSLLTEKLTLLHKTITRNPKINERYSIIFVYLQ